MNQEPLSAVLARYRLVRDLIGGRSVVDLSASPAQGRLILGEVPPAETDAPVVLFLTGLSLDRLRQALEVTTASGVLIVSVRLAAETGTGAYRFESIANFLRRRFAVVTYLYQHGAEFVADLQAISTDCLFVCWAPNGRTLDAGAEDQLDVLFGAEPCRIVPFSLKHLRIRLRPAPVTARSSPGRLLIYLQPLPLYDEPLALRIFFDRFYALGEEYRSRGWEVFYSTTEEIRTVFGAEHTLTPADFRPPPVEPWRAAYRKFLGRDAPADDPVVSYWLDYTRFVFDQSKPDAVLAWNKNTLLDRVAAERGALVIHTEVALDRAPKPPTYFFDPQGVNADSSLHALWHGYFAHAELPEVCQDLVDEYRELFVKPWLGQRSRAEVLLALGLDPAKPSILVPLQVEEDSNVIGNSRFASMGEFCESLIASPALDGCNIMVRPHPWDPQPQPIPEGVRERAVIPGPEWDMGALVQAADFVFTISSTAGYEALAAGKRVVCFGAAPYAGLGLTADLEDVTGLNKAMAFPEPDRRLMDRFLFLASIFYPISERQMWTAAESAERVSEWIRLRQQDAPALDYWAPGRVDWPAFAAAKRTEWLKAQVDLALDGEQRRVVIDTRTRRQQAAQLSRLQEEAAVAREESFDLIAGLSVAEEQLRAERAPAAATTQRAEELQAQLETARADITVLRTKLAAVEPQTIGAIRKRRLDSALQFVQGAVPEPVRAAVRRPYLDLFYYRAFPERRPPIEPPPAAPRRQPMDITLAGQHPAFPHLAATYRREGHNVFEYVRPDAGTRYCYANTRAFPDAVIIATPEAASWIASEGARLFIVEPNRSYSPADILQMA